jgi:hypothetical protein
MSMKFVEITTKTNDRILTAARELVENAREI